jgi:hypothetical protein
MLGKNVRFRPRGAGLMLAAVLLTAGLTACSPDSQSAEDAYKIGCPALDAAVAGSGTVKDAAVKGLETIRDSGQLDPQPQEWLETAIKALKSSNPKDLPADARKTLVDGCADHGYKLKNLS